MKLKRAIKFTMMIKMNGGLDGPLLHTVFNSPSFMFVLKRSDTDSSNLIFTLCLLLHNASSGFELNLRPQEKKNRGQNFLSIEYALAHISLTTLCELS